MFKVYRTAMALLATAIALPSQAFAATVYTDQASFNAAAAGTPLTLVDFAKEDTAGSRTFSGVKVSSSGALYYDDYANTSLAVGVSVPNTITFNLNRTVNFLGIRLIDFGTLGAQDMSVFTSSGSTQILSNYTGLLNNSIFRGIYDSAGFTSITFGGYNPANQSGDNYSLDDLQFGTQAVGGAVPEPATWGLMLVGFGVTGYAMRRRAKVRTNVSFA